MLESLRSKGDCVVQDRSIQLSASSGQWHPVAVTRMREVLTCGQVAAEAQVIRRPRDRRSEIYASSVEIRKAWGGRRL